jgi:hypothetical protein
MAFDAEYHANSFVPWPSLAITRSECDCGCAQRHHQVQLSFLFWTVYVTF